MCSNGGMYSQQLLCPITPSPQETFHQPTCCFLTSFSFSQVEIVREWKNGERRAMLMEEVLMEMTMNEAHVVA